MRRAALHAAIWAGAFAAVYPFVWMVGTAFKTLAEATTTPLRPWPSSPQWGNWAETFAAAPFGRYFLNSFLVSGAVTVSVVATALLAGYAFARLRFRGRGAVFALVLCTMMVPFEATLIPNFVLIGRLGWYNTHAALIVPWCASAFAIFLLRQALLGIPRDYEDAATVDGCGHLRFLVHVAAPLARPMLATAGLFAFLGSYNALLWPLIVTSDERVRVVQVGLTAFAGDAGLRLHLLMCASTIVILPGVLLYFAAQRHFVDAALGAGIKG